MPESEGDNFDIFIRDSIYPEAEGIFSFRPKALKGIKDSCFVILDTNSLLVPYTTGKDSLQQIAKIYRGLVDAKRLIVPGQVAREFADHRVTKIKELYQQISRKQTKLGLGDYPLLDGIDEYQKAHELEKQLNDLVREYNKSISAILGVIADWYWDDPVSALYGDLFAADVVLDPPFDREEMKTKLERDTLYKLPPGYKDARKQDEGIGDLLIWQTILNVGKTRQSSVIFVSLDKKPDWWSQSEGRPLYPRYELIDEFRRISSGQSFHILKFSSFLDLFGATEEVVEEIRKEEMQAILESSQPPYRQGMIRALSAEEAVFKWLWRQYPERVSFAKSGEGLDMTVDNTDGTFIGVEVKSFPEFRHLRARLRNSFQQMLRAFQNEKYSSFLLILVIEDANTVFPLDLMLSKIDESMRELGMPIPNFSVVVGSVGDEGEFKAVNSTRLN